MDIYVSIYILYIDTYNYAREERERESEKAPDCGMGKRKTCIHIYIQRRDKHRSEIRRPWDDSPGLRENSGFLFLC